MRTRRRPAGFASRAMRASSVLLVGVILAGLACGPAPKVGAEIPGAGGGGANATTFTEIRQTILEPRCATSGCHYGAEPYASPRLDSEAAYQAIYEVTLPGSPLPVVTPNDPDASYLMYALLGTTQDVGGSPMQMPPDAPLDDAEIEAIRAWIAAGAPND